MNVKEDDDIGEEKAKELPKLSKFDSIILNEIFLPLYRGTYIVKEWE